MSRTPRKTRTATKQTAPESSAAPAAPKSHAEAHAERIEQMLEQPNLSAASRKELTQTLAQYRGQKN